MAREELDDWLERSQQVLDEYDAHRASLSPDLGHRAVDNALLDEELFESTLRGSQDEQDEAIRAYKAGHHSPNFYT